jgi:hypothetical protein
MRVVPDDRPVTIECSRAEARELLRLHGSFSQAEIVDREGCTKATHNASSNLWTALNDWAKGKGDHA